MRCDVRVWLCVTGSIIRCMRRLEEFLRQMCQAAKAIGNTDLENKFAEGTVPSILTTRYLSVTAVVVMSPTICNQLNKKYIQYIFFFSSSNLLVKSMPVFSYSAHCCHCSKGHLSSMSRFSFALSSFFKRMSVEAKGSSRIFNLIKSVHSVFVFVTPSLPKEHFENVDFEISSQNHNAPSTTFFNSVPRPLSLHALVKMMTILDDH